MPRRPHLAPLTGDAEWLIPEIEALIQEIGLCK